MSDAVPPDPVPSNKDDPEHPQELERVQHEAEISSPPNDNWLAREIRTRLGWRSGSLRTDLETLLKSSPPDEIGFTPAERALLRNILDLRERRIADVMVQRADIIAVKEDIPLGDLMKLFESAALSRLVVYRAA